MVLMVGRNMRDLTDAILSIPGLPELLVHMPYVGDHFRGLLTWVGFCALVATRLRVPVNTVGLYFWVWRVVNCVGGNVGNARNAKTPENIQGPTQ